MPRRGWAWLAVGAVVIALVRALDLDKQVYVLGGGLAAFGLAQIANRAMATAGRTPSALTHILSDMAQMPLVMRRLAAAQFFTWIGLFIMWIYTTPVVTQYIFHSTDPASKAYNAGADWVGVLFGVYNGVTALAALLLPLMTKRWGPARTHMICLLAGAASYASILFIRDPNLMFVPMIGIGLTWASILTMPYVILSACVPRAKYGIYMGIFNVFIVIPQLLIATIMGAAIKAFFPHDPIWTMLAAALAMTVAALAMLRVTTAE
jgi:maltose/moltooligosaccharide transporter